MIKHAYLIIAHNNFAILEKLLQMLDCQHHDIYIHIDKKVKDFDFSYFKGICKASPVYFTSKRINVHWGHQTQVLTELLLFETAYNNGDYSYFHLLSGVDLPLKRAEDIYKFFICKAKSYLYVAPVTTAYDKARISRYRLNIKNEKIRSIINILQDKLKIDRTKNIVVKKGYNWCSLTEKAVGIILERKSEIRQMTFLSSCADEVYKQTILNKYAPDDIYRDESGNTTDMRYVDWSEKKNNPKILDETDLDKILTSERLFARKFDTEKSGKLIELICDFVANY